MGSVVVPPCGVVGDVLADGVHFVHVADDAFPIIPLPNRRSGRATRPVDAFGDGGFEPRYECAQ